MPNLHRIHTSVSRAFFGFVLPPQCRRGQSRDGAEGDAAKGAGDEPPPASDVGVLVDEAPSVDAGVTSGDACSNGLTLHFPLEPGAPGQEVVSDVVHSFFEPNIAIEDAAILFVGQQRLSLNEPVHVGHAWTISVWFRTPFPESESDLRFLSNAGHLGLFFGELGVWGVNGGHRFLEPRVNLYELLADNPGWHHLAGVGVTSETRFYVDGRIVGIAPKQIRQKLSVIGHMGDQEFGANIALAWAGALRDFMLFKRALSDKDVQALFAKQWVGITLSSS